MAKFFVGCRVKLVRPYKPINAGREGTITFLGDYSPGEIIRGRLTTMVGDVIVMWDGFDEAQQVQSQLEPILDRHEPCEAEFKESLDELLSREVKNEPV